MFNKKKYFCLSIQRTGTTSVGKFFKDHGFKWSDWGCSKKNNWSKLWYDGDFETIFSSRDFKKANAFEDSPWFLPGFYKILYHRFNRSKFILIKRNPENWFNSMLSHSKGKVLGQTNIHCKVYRREMEYYSLLDKGNINDKIDNIVDYNEKKIMNLSTKKQHYIDLYNLHYLEVELFFNNHNPEALFIGNLEDNDLWYKLGDYLNIKVSSNYKVHENKS